MIDSPVVYQVFYTEQLSENTFELSKNLNINSLR